MQLCNSHRMKEKSSTLRINAIKYGGPLWAVALLLFFFPWTEDYEANPNIVGLHFVFSLCFYDGT